MNVVVTIQVYLSGGMLSPGLSLGGGPHGAGGIRTGHRLSIQALPPGLCQYLILLFLLY